MKHTPLSNKHAKANAYQICIKCYESGVYFEMVKGRVMMRCSNCNAYIKWAIPEEYAGKEIVKFDYNKLF